MTDFQDRYKRLGFCREDIDTNRILRSQRRNQFRRDMRSEYFSKHRQIDNDDSLLDNETEETVKATQENNSKTEAKKNADAELQIAIQERLLQLEKWREERSRKKLKEKKKAKPAFKVGIVHHRIYSPPLVKKASPVKKICKSKEINCDPIQKKVTRATEKRLAAKALINQQKRENVRMKKQEIKESAVKNETDKIPFVSKNHQFKAPTGIMAMPMFGSQTLKMNKDNFQLLMHDVTESFKLSKSSSSLFNGSNINSYNLSSNKNLQDEMQMVYERENMESHIKENSDFINLQKPSINKRNSVDDLKTDISENQLQQSKQTRRSLRVSTPVAKVHSVHNSLVEPIICKMSCDDTEILYEDENMDSCGKASSNVINYSQISSRKKRKSGENINTDMLDNQLQQHKQKRRSLRFSTPVPTMKSVDNSLIEPVVLKMSSDDTEILYEAENTDSHLKEDSDFRNLPNSSVHKRISGKDIKIDVSDNGLEQSIPKRRSLRNPTSAAAIQSVDNSLVEPVILKMSSNDTELKYGDENMDNNDIDLQISSLDKRKSGEDIKTDTSEKLLKQSKQKRKSARISKPLATMFNNTFDEQFTMKDQINMSSDNKNEGSSMDLNLSQKMTPSLATRRSRRFTNNKLEKNLESTSEFEKILDNQENIDINRKHINLSMDCSYLEPKKTLVNQRKSSQIFTENIINSEKFENESSFILHYEDSMLSDEVSKVNQNAEPQPSFLNEDQEMPEVQEDSNFRISNIMDCSVSKLNKIKSLRQKQPIKINNEWQKTVSNLQEHSLIKFSPRSSMRLQNIKNSPEQTSKDIEKSLIANQNNLNQSITLNTEYQKFSEMDQEKSHDLSLNTSIDKPPASFSPFIVMSRGKSSMRKEIRQRRFSKVSSTDIPTKDTIMQSLNISAEEEERTAQFYKYILNNEITRLNEICDKWNLIKEENSTPDDIRYEIQAAVGQTQLLINKKFERFRSLVNDCETGKGEMLVTCKDLQGFWDMMYMEIKDCDSRFNRLEELKCNDWVGDESQEVPKVVLPKKKVPKTKKATAKKNSGPAKTSSLRAHIMAARKRKVESREADGDLDTKEVIVIEENKILQNSITKQNKSRTSTPTSSTRRNSSTKKLSNKRQSKKGDDSQDQEDTADYSILPEIQLDTSIIYINSDRTPAKGILKSARDESSIIGKSTNKVFFKEQPMEFMEFDDSVTSDEINTSLNNFEQAKKPIEIRLDFENSSFNTSRMSDDQNIEEVTKNITCSFNCGPSFNTIDKKIGSSPIISISPLKLNESKDSTTRKSGGKRSKQISFKESTPNTRVLRSNVFAPPLTPRPKFNKSIEKDLHTEVDDSKSKSSEKYTLTPEQTQVKELYLNANGVVCERFVSVKKNISRTSRLRRNNSEVMQIDALSNNITTNLDSSTQQSTPRFKKRNSEKVSFNNTISELNSSKSLGETTPVQLRRISRRIKTPVVGKPT